MESTRTAAVDPVGSFTRDITAGQVLAAPVLALFSRRLYLAVAASSLARGFLYLVYLSALSCLGVLLWGEHYAMPELDRFVSWFASECPSVTFTRDGPIVAARQPVDLSHPTVGRVLYIDTSRAVPDEAVPAWMWLTATQVVFTNMESGERSPQHRTLDVTPRTPDARANWHDWTVTGAMVTQTYGTYRPYWVLLLGLAFPIYFIWKLSAALMYVLVAVVLNRVFHAKRSFAALLNVTFFAMTPVVVAEWMSLFGIPSPFTGLWASVLLTAVYLFLAIRWIGPQPMELER